MIYTLAQLAKALQQPRTRLEQWISREYFSTKPISGKAREWDFGEAMRLALFVRLVDSNISPLWAGLLTRAPLQGFVSDKAFFVAWSGLTDLVTNPQALAAGKIPPKIHSPGTWFHDIVRGSELAEYLANPDIWVATVICLDHLERSVTEALAAVADKNPRAMD